MEKQTINKDLHIFLLTMILGLKAKVFKNIEDLKKFGTLLKRECIRERNREEEVK